ncbi:hypothetical protein SAMN05216582_106117 [Selenomonas ruminantium]|uniref:Uncharacterized protein n=2 Tax=Selenomonas ruminantium TaxID=971 RepID=A0A1M6T6P9_SELRU|nr:hypothetical protein SAMN05216582_106117 [Selenomonas ruminantium]
MAWLNELKETDLYFRDVLKPVIVMTDRGVFEIDFHESSSVRISKDCIPERYYNNSGNRFNRSFDLRKILALLNGDIINNISVEEQNFSDADFQFTGICNIVLDSKFSSYIKTFTLHLDSGRKIVFFSDFDNGGFYVLDKDDSLIKILTKDLNKYLKVPIGTKIKE